MPRTFDQKTLLVTGATGFIGTHLVERLRQVAGARLVLVSRRAVAQATRKDETWVAADLRTLSPATWRAAGIGHLDFVFHLGSFTPKSAAQANEIQPILHDNLEGTWALLESFPSVPERLVLASTLDVYAPPADGVVLSERSPCSPAGLYGTSKLFVEQMAAAHARARGYSLAILRYGHIFGPGEDAYGKLIPQAIRQMVAGQAPAVYGDGGAERDFLYVGDAVEAAVRAALADRAALGPVNVVRGESHPIRHVVETLAGAVGFPGRIAYLRNEPRGPSLRFDNARMRELLGEWPLVPLEEGLYHEVQSVRRTHPARKEMA